MYHRKRKAFQYLFRYYERCSFCDIGGDNTNNNCKECAKDENGN